MSFRSRDKRYFYFREDYGHYPRQGDGLSEEIATHNDHMTRYFYMAYDYQTRQGDLGPPRAKS